MSEALDRINDGIASLYYSGAKEKYQDHFVYAILLSRLDKYPNNKMNPGTMAVAFHRETRKVCLYYNEEFTLGLSISDLQGVLVHEAKHIVHLHFDRLGKHAIKSTWSRSMNKYATISRFT